MRFFAALRAGLVGVLRGIGSALVRCLRGMRDNAGIQIAAMGTVGLLLLLCGTLRLCGVNLSRLLAELGKKVEMVVYLSDGVTAERAGKIAEVMGRLPGVAEVRTVTAKEAYERLRRSLGDRADLLDGVEEDLLPMSLEVSFKGGVSDILRVHPLYSRLRATEGVEDVELMGDWVRRLLLLQRLVHGVGLAVLGLAVLVSLVIVGWTIRLGVHARRDEIEVLKLVGATDLHVYAPFLLEGFLQGVIGTGLSAGALYGGYLLLLPLLQGALRDLGATLVLAFVPGYEIAGAVLGLGVVGLLGSAAAVGRHVKV